MDIHVSPQIERLIRDALDEDIGAGDLATMATISADSRGTGVFRAKKEGVVAGLVLLDRIFYFIDHRVELRLHTKDGAEVTPGMVVAEAVGPVRALLLAERTALNFLQRLSGNATLTRKYVEAVKNYPCKVLDTRKTTPGLRTLEKYAVRMGGGMNHRIGLYDAALVKDNHIEATGSIAKAVKAVRRHAPFMAKVEVEASNLQQVREALDAGADVIMLDNMTLAQMTEAVELVNKRAWIEASGGITLETIRQVAETGVDFISSGALTHSAPVVDFNMKITLNTN
ncbi:MAG TPA: carboxylating nicotinate-nucleotide diphosphorylase [Candidatus Binatia bacterium]|jgi:nicotinate-nucleotide pyrophosphorylase (carboxylating)|nr:carboxylating nicotinate-nucleotide diphosphorylase [Candidatus Binatia bacterium]